jgi:hypothetical protein
MNHVGFNITENKLQLVEVVENSRNYFLESVDEETFPELLNFQYSGFSDFIQTALDNLKQRNMLKSIRASVALPLDLFRIFSFPFEISIENGQLQEQIEWEFSILFPTLSFKDHIVRKKKILTGINSYPEIFAMAIDKKIVKSLHEFLIANKLSLVFVDNAHFTSDLMINKNNSISVYTSKNATTCCSYANNELMGFRKFDPSNNLTLIEYVRNSMSQKDFDFNNFFISGDVEFETLQSELENSLKINFNLINPFSNIQLSNSFIQNDHFISRAALFSSASGICFRKS